VANAPTIQVAVPISSPASTARLHDNTLNSTRRQDPASNARADAVRFAHPAERHIARLFDAHGVRWLYEPTTFPLISSLAGEPLQSFTPDFYLPDHRIYLEMTTMRQSLVTRKNRKFRLMRESYPELDVRLVYRKDVELIMDWYGLAPVEWSVLPGTVITTEEQVMRKVHEIATRLRSGAGPVVLVAVGGGGAWLRDEVVRALAESATAASVAQLEQVTSGSASIAAEQRLVLVADIVGTGLTVDAALRTCRAAGRAVSAVIALLDRRSARLVDIELAVPGLPAPAAWIAGCGLGPAPFAARSDLITIARVAGV
jgi:hypoxanthine-guanine phosphoribosyltransferase